MIESKKLFVWNSFFDVKECFVQMKHNLFDSNKISLDQINICSNQINFCLKSNKLYLWPYINALISLLWMKINLIETNIYLVQRYFIWNFLKFVLATFYRWKWWWIIGPQKLDRCALFDEISEMYCLKQKNQTVLDSVC